MNLEPLQNLNNLEKLLIPAKTFLVGEYAALAGGNSLCLATKPYFTFSFNSTCDLHDKSAASNYLKIHNLKPEFKLTSSSHFKGLGLSTAEFIAAWIQVYHQKSDKKINLEQVYEEYLNLYADQNLTSKPSGVDLLTQMSGRITSVVKHNDCLNLNFVSASHDWPFKNVSFYILSTGYKENTHEHLAKLDRSALTDLVPLSNNVVAAFLDQDWSKFLSGMKAWSQALIAKGLTCESSRKLKASLEENNSILLAKPCGAGGTDTILIFFETQNKKSVQDYINSLGLSIIANENDLANGVLS